MAHRPIIAGEYACVSQKTSCYELLDRLHDTPITQDAALELIRRLAEIFHIRLGRITFKRGHLGHARWKTHNMILPATPKQGTRRVGFLRIGIVVHEVSHLLAEQRGCKTHGDLFVKTLDELVQYTCQHLAA